MAPAVPTLFGMLVERWAHHDATAPAMVVGPRSLSYGQLTTVVDRLAGILLAEGVRPGDRVLLQFANSAEYVASLLATTVVGGVAVAVQASGPLAYIVELTQPRLCLRGDSFAPISGVRSRPVTIDFDDMSIVPPGEGAALAALPTPKADDAALILFSSGSTGRPKAVVLGHDHLLATSENMSTICGLRLGHRDLVIAPMQHSGGWQRMAATLYAGGCLVIAEGPITPPSMLKLLPELDIHGFFVPSTFLRMLLRFDASLLRGAMKALRSVELGSTTVAAEEFRILADLVPNGGIYFYYGLTECSRATILVVREHPEKLGTVGKSTPGVEIRICDDAGRPLPPGEAGEIWLRGRQRTNGYFGRPDLDREKLSDGWLLTGDHGRLDADGFLQLLGRRDDMITCASFHFFPAEVEIELGRVPGVSDYFVVGTPDPRGMLGDVPHAFARPDDPASWRPDSFIAFARTKLPAHMVPRAVTAVPAFPLTPSGKVDRKSTIERFAPKAPVTGEGDPASIAKR